MVVGAGQVTNREVDPPPPPTPSISWRRPPPWPSPAPGTAAAAAEVTHCWMVHSLSLRHGDPAAVLAGRLGVDGAETRCSGMGGNIPQWLVNRAADLVAAGAAPGSSSPAPRPWPPAAGQAAGRRARLALDPGLARHLAPPRARHGHPPGRAGPRPRSGHHHVRAHRVGPGPRRRPAPTPTAGPWVSSWNGSTPSPPPIPCRGSPPAATAPSSPPSHPTTA